MSTNKKRLYDKKSRITSDDIDNCPDVNKLIELKTTIAANLLQIKEEIELAAANHAKTGKYSDPEWWVKANSYRRVLGHLHQRCGMKERFFKQQKSQLDKDAGLNEWFRRIAEDTLPSATYYSILSSAHEKINQP